MAELEVLPYLFNNTPSDSNMRTKLLSVGLCPVTKRTPNAKLQTAGDAHRCAGQRIVQLIDDLADEHNG